MTSHPQSSREQVVLIHGLAARPWMMGLLASRLRAEGFGTSAFFYRSMRSSIPQLAERFIDYLQQVDADPQVDRLHIVCHSMGGIVTRQALLNAAPKKLSRVVMLAPPNHGSFTAALWGPIVRPICPAASQLSSRDGSFVNSLGEPKVGEWAVLAAKYDRVVAVESTRLHRSHQHRIIPTGHLRLLIRRDVARFVAGFLKTGRLAESARQASNSPLADAIR